jgi:hypothetical protein
MPSVRSTLMFIGRQIEVKFFLDHWAYIRSSNAMRDVWQQIRMGRHPGFEEGGCCWPNYKR